MEDSSPNLALPDLACLRLAGIDAGDFLQSQLSVDVLGLGNTRSRLAVYCDIKGRVLTTLIVARSRGDYLLLVPTTLLSSLEDTLRRYKLRARVDFSREAQIAGCEHSAGEIPHPLDQQRSFRLGAGQSDTSGRQKWALADIETGMVWLDPRTSLRHLPQSLGMVDGRGLDFSKGCYPGQEIVARLHYLGKSKYGLYRVRCAATGPEPDDIRDSSGHKLGQWLNFVRANGQYHGLAVLRRTPADGGLADKLDAVAVETGTGGMTERE